MYIEKLKIEDSVERKAVNKWIKMTKKQQYSYLDSANVCFDIIT